MRRRVHIWTVAGIGLSGVVLVLALAPQQGRSVASLYNPGAYGASLLVRLLEQNGWVVAPWERPLQDLVSRGPGWLVMVAPDTVLAADREAGLPQALRAWLERGGRLLYLGRFLEVETTGTEPFFHGLWQVIVGMDVTPRLQRARVPRFWDIWRPARPTRVAWVGSGRLPVLTAELVPYRWSLPHPARAATWMVWDEQPLMVRFPVGNGALVVGHTAAWVENRFLTATRARNAEALLALFQKPSAPALHTVWIDEFHHGFMDPAVGNAGATHVQRVYRWLWAYSLLLAVLAVYTWSRRPGPVHRLELPETPTGVAFLYQIAGLLQREGFVPVARAALVRYLAYLGRRYRHRIAADPVLRDLWRRVEPGLAQENRSLQDLARWAVDLTRRLHGPDRTPST